MAQYRSFEKGIEVNGATVNSFIEGMDKYKELFPKIDESMLTASHWFDQQKWLNALEIICQTFGDARMFLIGAKIPENAIFPPEIDSIEKGLQAIDIAYHINHRNAAGQILYDENREEEMIEGIGHYHFEKSGEKTAKIISENPYPCAFDRGIVDAVSIRFKPMATVRHMDEKECRRQGFETCTYEINW